MSMSHNRMVIHQNGFVHHYPGADPGFLVGVKMNDNERIGAHRGRASQNFVCRSANVTCIIYFQEYFEDLVKFMSSGPSHILILTKGETGEGIIEEWRSLLGPASVEEAKEQAPDR